MLYLRTWFGKRQGKGTDVLSKIWPKRCKLFLCVRPGEDSRSDILKAHSKTQMTSEAVRVRGGGLLAKLTPRAHIQHRQFILKAFGMIFFVHFYEKGSFKVI